MPWPAYAFTSAVGLSNTKNHKVEQIPYVLFLSLGSFLFSSRGMLNEPTLPIALLKSFITNDLKISVFIFKGHCHCL